jgi:hypothetical protein
MSLESFEEFIRTSQNELFSRWKGSERNSSRDTSRGDTWERACFTNGASNGEEYRHEVDDDIGNSTEGRDHTSITSTSGSDN